jgi:DNA-binding FrmR family transcriptional regulator
MLEEGRNCLEIAQQLQAVEKAVHLSTIMSIIAWATRPTAKR